MEKFIFTNKDSDEVIGSSKIPKTIEEAISHFSKIKNLPVDEFVKLYGVKLIKK
jgi:hypothetical protein